MVFSENVMKIPVIRKMTKIITFNTFACILLQRKNSVFFAFNYYWIK